MHTPSQKLPLFSVILLCPELRPFIIIIPISHPFVMHLIIHMFHTSVIAYISLDVYLNPNLYTILNMQNMRFFCCSVYIRIRDSIIDDHRGALIIYLYTRIPNNLVPGRVAQSVTCLATDACLTAIPGVASSIPARSHTFVEIDHEIISTVILLPSADSFKKGCCQLQAKVCARITG